ncbi:MAG TPA: DUF177 domain-containing protein [Acidimicrobiia bacterium]|jgi:uncharacterized protein
MSHRILVSDLLAKPGASRKETGAIRLDIDLTNAAVHGDATFEATLRSLSDGLVARGDATVDAELACNRCLEVNTATLEVPFEQVYRYEPQDTDDEMRIENSSWVDLEPAVHDEVTLSLPIVPVCKPDCLGLCPTCGANLNTEPCDGHDDDSDSPFAALRDLFES